MADRTNPISYKRKRKKSFIKQQIRHGKRGKFGRGTELTEDNYQYFLHIYEVLKASKNDPEALENLSENVLEEIKEKEFETCCNQLASRVIEELISYMSDASLMEFGHAISENMRLIFLDPFASHVIQGVLINSLNRLKDENFLNIFLKISKFGLNNLEEFIFDSYANRVLRSIVWCLNGYPVKNEEQIPEKQQVPDEFGDILKQFIDKLINWGQFRDLMNQDLTSGFLQSVLNSSKDNLKLTKKIIKKFLTVVDPKNINFERNDGILRLLEVTITCPLPKLFKKQYEIFFKDNLSHFALTKSNFALQKLILHSNLEIFNEIFQNLTELFDKIFDKGFFGVFTALAKMSRQLKCNTGEFFKLLVKSLNCADKKFCFGAICCMTKFNNEEVLNGGKINLQGSVILQELLQSTRPDVIVNSFLELSVENIVKILTDPRGSHICDAFTQSLTVGNKNKEKLVERLKGSFLVLGSTKHGSRSFDAIWAICDREQKQFIMEELKKNQSALLSTQMGKLIGKKYRLEVYRENIKQWILLKL